MAKVRVVANPMRVGRVGADTFYVVNGAQVIRPSKNNSNYGESASRSQAQQERRVKWSNLVAFYKLSKLFMSRAFETKERTQSDYNKFMSVNMNRTQVSLTKEEANQGACVVEPLRISLGTLTPITYQFQSNALQTNLIFTESVSLDMSVGEFSANLIADNPELVEGMQLSIITYTQELIEGVPRAFMNAIELTLDITASTVNLGDKLQGMTISSTGGTIAFGFNRQPQGVALIWSYSADGKGIRVSTQDVILIGSQDVYNEWSSDTKAAQARESYGEDAEHFLESGDL